MGLTDLIVAPFFLVLLYLVAFYLRRERYRDLEEGKFFLPGLTLKLGGAIGLGLIYEFYYGGGDTLVYHQGAQVLWETFWEAPWTFVKILFSSANEYDPVTQEYAFRIVYYNDPHSFFVVKLAGLAGLLTFGSYTGIALLFALFSFSGLWVSYRVFTDLFPQYKKHLAVPFFFVPTVILWGSGLLKDTLTMGAMGWLIYSVYFGFIKTENLKKHTLILIVNAFLLFHIKPYVLICFAPAAAIWVFISFKDAIRVTFVRRLVTPFLIVMALGAGFLLIRQLSSETKRYRLSNMVYTAQQMQKWHKHVSETRGGSGYSLGDYPPTFIGLLSKAPASINVALFRPYLWEAHNVMMLFVSLESTVLLLLTLFVLVRSRWRKFITTFNRHPVLYFCLLFSLAFAFAVGFTSYNFGALSRYRIPCLPYFVSFLLLLYLLSRAPTSSESTHK